MKVIPFPGQRAQDISGALRLLADSIDSNAYGEVHGLAWVMNSGKGEIDVGLLGGGSQPTLITHYLLCLGQRQLETLTDE